MSAHAPAAARYAPLLRSGRWFRGLPVELQEALLGAAVVRNIPAGKRIFSRGDAPDGLYAVVDGCIRIGALTEQSGEVVLTMIEAPGWTGEISAIDRGPRTHDATAQVDSVIVHVTQESLEALLAARPEHWRQIAMLSVSKVRVLFGAHEDSVAARLPTRLARHLILLAGGLGEREQRRVVTVGQRQLASMLGASRQKVNQLLQSFAAEGLVRLAYRRIELVDVAKLEAMAQSSVSDM